MGGDPRHGTAIRKEELASDKNIIRLIYPQDSFYKSLGPEEHKRAHGNDYDFDCPDSIDFDVLVQVLRDLKQG
jgi:uridine kinase